MAWRLAAIRRLSIAVVTRRKLGHALTFGGHAMSVEKQTRAVCQVSYK